MALDARVDRLEAALARLAEAQTRTEQRVAELGAGLATLTARVDALTARVDDLAQGLAALTARVDALTARVDALTARVDALTARVDALTLQMDRLVGVVGGLKGQVLELTYREKAHAYFLPIVLGIRGVPRDELATLARDAERRQVPLPDLQDLLLADVVVRGHLRAHDAEGYLVAEVSAVVDEHDVARAARRARLLATLTGAPVAAAVAGEHLTPEADRAARAAGVWRVVDGRALPPDSPPLP